MTPSDVGYYGEGRTIDAEVFTVLCPCIDCQICRPTESRYSSAYLSAIASGFWGKPSRRCQQSNLLAECDTNLNEEDED